MSNRSINKTTKYDLFVSPEDNRPLDILKHAGLKASMKRYGFLRSHPLSVIRMNGKLVLKDGQHRLAIAQELGIPVWWVEDEVDYDIAVVNETQKTWKLIDYAMMYARRGKQDYQEALDFAERHDLSLLVAFQMLGGYAQACGFLKFIKNGSFVVKDRMFADIVAEIYVAVGSHSKDVRNARFIEACIAVCRVKGFDHKRLIHNARNCVDKLQAFSQRDPYLDMIEEIYNFRSRSPVPLKIPALNALKVRKLRTRENESN